MKARLFIISGFMMILGSLLLSGYNIYSDVSANNIAVNISGKIEENIIANDNEWEDVYLDAPKMEMIFL